MTAENMNVPMTITTISEEDHSDHCIPRTVYNDSVWVDTSHIVVGLDGYSETKTVTIEGGSYSASAIAEMIRDGKYRWTDCGEHP